MSNSSEFQTGGIALLALSVVFCGISVAVLLPLIQSKNNPQLSIVAPRAETEIANVKAGQQFAEFYPTQPAGAEQQPNRVRPVSGYGTDSRVTTANAQLQRLPHQTSGFAFGSSAAGNAQAGQSQHANPFSHDSSTATQIGQNQAPTPYPSTAGFGSSSVAQHGSTSRTATVDSLSALPTSSSLYAPITVHPVTVNVDGSLLGSDVKALSEQIESVLKSNEQAMITDAEQKRVAKASRNQNRERRAHDDEISRISQGVEELASSFRKLQQETRQSLHDANQQTDRSHVSAQLLETYRAALELEQAAARQLAEQQLAHQRITEQQLAQQALEQQRKLAEQTLAQQRIAEQQFAQQALEQQKRLAEQTLAQQRIAEQTLQAQQRLIEQQLALQQATSQRIASLPVETHSGFPPMGGKPSPGQASPGQAGRVNEQPETWVIPRIQPIPDLRQFDAAPARAAAPVPVPVPKDSVPSDSQSRSRQTDSARSRTAVASQSSEYSRKAANPILLTSEGAIDHNGDTFTIPTLPHLSIPATTMEVLPDDESLESQSLHMLLPVDSTNAVPAQASTSYDRDQTAQAFPIDINLPPSGFTQQQSTRKIIEPVGFESVYSFRMAEAEDGELNVVPTRTTSSDGVVCAQCGRVHPANASHALTAPPIHYESKAATEPVASASAVAQQTKAVVPASSSVTANREATAASQASHTSVNDGSHQRKSPHIGGRGMNRHVRQSDEALPAEPLIPQVRASTLTTEENEPSILHRISSSVKQLGKSIR